MNIEPLIQLGAVGAILVWFMFRNEKKTDQMTRALNNQSKVMIYLIDVISGCPSNGRKIRDLELNKLKEELNS